MKSKTVHTIIGAILFIAIVVVWKLNSYYKQEKSAFLENQIHQQTLSLTTSVSSQLSQLKNIISSYHGQVDEGKINWVQMSPFFALAQVEISAQGIYKVKTLFVKSGTAAESWSSDYVQKAFSYSRYSNKDIHAQLFQNRSGDKFLSLIFSEQKIQNSRQAVALIGEASYFQKYFDAQRGAKATNLLMTTDEVVVGHTQSEYIATKSQEQKLNPAKYSMDKDEIRSSNLFVISYAAKQARSEFFAIPLFVLVFIFGFVLVLMGIFLYTLRPIENENRKAEIFKKVFDEVQQKPLPWSPSNSIMPTPNVPLTTVLETEAEIVDAFVRPPPPPPPMVNNSADVAALPTVLVGVKKVKPAVVVQAAMTTLAEPIKSAGLKIETVFESEKKYECDPERFRKAIENIIMNSIEAHSRKMTIKIYDVKSPAGISTLNSTNIDIIDDGKGIEPGVLNKIWQPYFGTKDKLKHKGLGLSESISVVRRYGADIRIMNKSNLYSNGTTVRIEMNALQSQALQLPPEASSMIHEGSDEIDIDALLSLDDGDEVEVVDIINQKIEREFTTTQFKMDQQVKIETEPRIDFKKTSKPIDHLDVKVRKPGRS